MNAQTLLTRLNKNWVRLNKNWRSTFRPFLPDIMPKRLFPRTLIIVAAPLVLLQSILAFVSMERHWQLVTARLSETTASSIAALIDIHDQKPDDPAGRRLVVQTAHTMGFDIAFLTDAELPPERPEIMFDILDDVLGAEIRSNIDKPFWINTSSTRKYVEVRVKLNNEIMRLTLRRNRTYASNTHIFIVWMVGSSVILLLIAILFLRNQIRPILQLANAADRFGKGLSPDGTFHPHGALEIRRASNAFLRMRDRIQRHVEQRTTMLAGVSHDLRTILTRFKLELALIGDSPEIEAMRKDVDEMQNMINAYMNFAKGEENEATSLTSINTLLTLIGNEMARMNKPVTLHLATDGLVLPLRRDSFKRAITNCVANAARYGDKVELSTKNNGDQLLIQVDDNGPGIAPEDREKVFQPFFRLEDARTQYEGSNTGLGLSIAQDIVHSHGGLISLDDSPLGGLRVSIQLPL